MLRNLHKIGFNRKKYPELAGLTVNQIALIETGALGWNDQIQTRFHTGSWMWNRYNVHNNLHEHMRTLLPEFVEYEYFTRKWLVPRALRFKELDVRVTKNGNYYYGVFHGVPGRFYFGGLSIEETEVAIDRFLERQCITQEDIYEINERDDEGFLGGEEMPQK